MAKRGDKGGGQPPEDDIGKKVDEIDKKFNVTEIRKFYKARLVARINKGEVGLLDELQKLEQLERGELPGSPSLLPSPAPGDGEVEVEYGIPERLRVKRDYHMSEAALKQRQAAASSPAKSKAMEGNKNAYKTGEHAHGFIRQIFRPCKSTCEKYPCGIVDEGETEPGELCLDKVQFVKTLQTIQAALKNNKIDDFKDLAALRIAGGMEIVDRLIRDILEDGTIVKSEKWDKDGRVLGYELKNHPALPFLAKLMEVMNLSPQDFMITPLIIKKQKTEAKKVRTLGGIIGSIGKAFTDPEDGDEG
jgi:hypothetical protein